MKSPTRINETIRHQPRLSMANCTVVPARSTRIPVASTTGKGASPSPVRAAHKGDRKSMHTVIAVTPKKCIDANSNRNLASTAEIIPPCKTDPSREEWENKDNDEAARSGEEYGVENSEENRNRSNVGIELISLEKSIHKSLERSLESQASLQSSTHSSSSLSTVATTSSSSQSSAYSSSNTDRHWAAGHHHNQSTSSESSSSPGAGGATFDVSASSCSTTNTATDSTAVAAIVDNVVGGVKILPSGCNGLTAQIAEGKSKVGVSYHVILTYAITDTYTHFKVQHTRKHIHTCIEHV
ncbi:hypothetical protein BgiMline_015272 [Biomphalaria glabrata]|nr:hypothetical protein BgiMline_022379 [Biomphalaria glabrata]